MIMVTGRLSVPVTSGVVSRLVRCGFGNLRLKKKRLHKYLWKLRIERMNWYTNERNNAK